jgi:hypothetical protein
MTMQRASREATWTAVFHTLTLLVSAAIVVFPTWRPLPASKIAILLMTVGMLVVFIRQESRRRTLGLTIPQIYALARRGQKFAPRGLELAATIVWCWAMMLSY